MKNGEENNENRMENSVLDNTATEKSQMDNVANTDTGNCIACTKEDKPMQTDLKMKSTLSRDDVRYIRNLLAEGIARRLVEKVAKSSDLAVDESEPERYNPHHSKKEVP